MSMFNKLKHSLSLKRSGSQLSLRAEASTPPPPSTLEAIVEEPPDYNDDDALTKQLLRRIEILNRENDVLRAKAGGVYAAGNADSKSTSSNGNEIQSLLREQRDHFSLQQEGLAAEICRMSESQKTSKATIRTLTDEVARWKREAKAKEILVAEHLERPRQLDQGNRKLSEDVNRGARKVDTLRARVQDSDDAILKQNDTISRLQSQLTSSQNQAQLYQARAASALRERQETEGVIAKLRSELQIQNDLKEKLRRETAARSASDRRAKDLHQELKQKDEALAQVKSKNDVEMQRLKSKLQCSTEDKSELEELQQRIKTADKVTRESNIEHVRTLQELTLRIRSASQDRDDLAIVKQELSTKVKELEKMNDDNLGKVQDLEFELQRLTGERDVLNVDQHHQHDAEQKLDERDDMRITDLESEVQSLKQERDELKEAQTLHEWASSQVEDDEARIQSYQRKIDELDFEVFQLDKEMVELRDKVFYLGSLAQAERDRTDSAENEIQVLANERDAAKAEVSVAILAREEFQAQISALKSECDALESANEQHKVECKKMEVQLKQALSDSTATGKNLESMRAENDSNKQALKLQNSERDKVQSQLFQALLNVMNLEHRLEKVRAERLEQEGVVGSLRKDRDRTRSFLAKARSDAVELEKRVKSMSELRDNDTSTIVVLRNNIRELHATCDELKIQYQASKEDCTRNVERLREAANAHKVLHTKCNATENTLAERVEELRKAVGVNATWMSEKEDLKKQYEANYREASLIYDGVAKDKEVLVQVNRQEREKCKALQLRVDELTVQLSSITSERGKLAEEYEAVKVAKDILGYMKAKEIDELKSQITSFEAASYRLSTELREASRAQSLAVLALQKKKREDGVLQSQVESLQLQLSQQRAESQRSLDDLNAQLAAVAVAHGAELAQFRAEVQDGVRDLEAKVQTRDEMIRDKTMELNRMRVDLGQERRKVTQAVQQKKTFDMQWEIVQQECAIMMEELQAIKSTT